MELNEYKQIKNRRYSPKEVVANFVAGAKSFIGVTDKNLISKIGEQFVKNFNNKNILECLSINSLEKITNYWSVSIEQAISYGFIVFSNLSFENKEFSENEIVEMFVYVMKVYSPDNAVEFAERKLSITI